MCVHTYYTGFLLYLQYDTQRFIALKCKHLKTRPKLTLERVNINQAVCILLLPLDRLRDRR